MKNYIVFLCFLLLLGCKSLETNPDCNFTYHEISYLNNKVFDEYIYDSKTKIYISREMKNFDLNEIEEKKIYVNISPEKLQKIHQLYLLLKITNPNKCIYNKETGEILSKSVIRFYKDKAKWQDETCNVDVENEKFTNLWGKIDETIASTPEYKEVFKLIGK